MTAVSDAITAHDALTSKIATDLDTLHVDLVNLFALKATVNALGADSAWLVEAGVAVPMTNVPTLHEEIKTVRDVMVSIANSLRGGTGVDLLKAHNWETELSAQTAITRQ